MYFAHGQDMNFGGVGRLLQIELYPPKYIVKSQNPVRQNETLFGNQVFREVIKFK